ncbi:cofactor-independent phosphoglycerate mutase [Chloroflexota bacterium]
MMKHGVLIIDGAAGLPLAEYGGKTCFELARTPNLDAMAREGTVGLARTVPPGMEPSSACACLSILGYDPLVYLPGRAAIEAMSMGIAVGEAEVAFRCNLVSVQNGKMRDYSSGHIGTGEARPLITALQEEIGSDQISFYPGISYRHICKIAGHSNTLLATCTPPHDIPNKPVDGFLPRGPGSELLQQLMAKSVPVLRDHPVTKLRKSRGETPADMIWLFWGSGKLPDMPSFRQVYGLSAALTSGVDLLGGLAQIAGIDFLNIPGVTDGPDNDYAAQALEALAALRSHDMVVIHIESPDEAAHSGSIDNKIAAIERVDSDVVSQLRQQPRDDFRALIMPDHPTPIETRTHSPEPVPFLLWGKGFSANGASGFSEAEAKKTGFLIADGYKIMGRLIGDLVCL